MTDTIKLENTLVQLDSLYKSYDALLESAKEQLQSLDISDLQLTTIANKVKEHNDFKTFVKNSLRDYLNNLLRSSSEEAEHVAFRGIVKLLTEKVWENMVPMVQRQIDETVTEAIIKSDITSRVETKVAQAVATNATVDEALNSASELQVLKTILAPKS